MLQQLDTLLLQDHASARRFTLLGAAPERIKVVGNLKYDVVIPPPQQLDKIQHSQLDQGYCLVCGSTRPGEESILLQAWAQLPDTISGTLVLVPRHPQRFTEVADLCDHSGLPWSRISDPEITPITQGRRLILVDAMGLLLDLYRLADLVFVGGSLADYGGHNPLEAAALSKAVLMGPYCYNNAQVCSQLEAVGGLQITTARHVCLNLQTLLLDPALCQRMGQAGYHLVQQQKGTLARHLQHIRDQFYIQHRNTKVT